MECESGPGVFWRPCGVGLGEVACGARPAAAIELPFHANGDFAKLYTFMGIAWLFEWTDDDTRDASARDTI